MSHRKNPFVGFTSAESDEIGSQSTARKSRRSESLIKKTKDFALRHKKFSCAESLKKGYESMSEINLEIAEFCLEADNIQQQSYEEKLAECE